MTFDLAEKWGKVKKKFNTHTDMLDPSSVDNVLVVWPTMINLIHKHHSSKPLFNSIALDYGCGTGGFCNELYDLGCRVAGLGTLFNHLDLILKKEGLL